MKDSWASLGAPPDAFAFAWRCWTPSSCWAFPNSVAFFFAFGADAAASSFFFLFFFLFTLGLLAFGLLSGSAWG
jgi:hypothetical protein